MRIGLASDCHGNVDDLVRALDRFVAEKVDRIFFLGGRYADVDRAVTKVRIAVPDLPPSPEGVDPFLSAFRGALAAQAGGGGVPDQREKLLKRIVRVASRACPEYGAGSVPKKLMELAEGHVLCLVHDKSELNRDDITNAAVLIHGNSAAPAVVQIGPRVFVTPGHLRRPAPDGRPATWAVLELEPRALTLVVYGLDGKELARQKGELGGHAKMVVK
jgi:predicted phosphodiesterase